MGYSISEEQYQRLEQNRRDGRDCHMSTRGGGCFTRATRKVTTESWPYKIGEGEPRTHTSTFCARHAHKPGYEGMNFRVLAVEKIRP
jgi:hypothetical protein